ncbi:MAG: hypothetical protein N2594_02375 [Clostridiales bacterium]|nr:hypothetical protein [Clostridiales bacterium]
MVCVKIFQKPDNNLFDINSIDNIVTNNNSILAIAMESCGTCSISNVLKKMKIRSLSIGNYLFNRFYDLFKDYGYDVQKVTNDDGDIIKIKVSGNNRYFEILYCGVFLMDKVDKSIIEACIPILLGDD